MLLTQSCPCAFDFLQAQQPIFLAPLLDGSVIVNFLFEPFGGILEFGRSGFAAFETVGIKEVWQFANGY